MNDVLSKPIIRAELNKILHYWTADEDDDDADIDFSEGEEEDGDNSFLAALARDLPPEEMRALVERFVTETDRAFDALVPLAQSEENRKEVTSIVHKTAGSAGSFGLDELHAALAEAQTQLKTNPDYNMPEGVAELSQAWLGARVEITMMMLGYGINLELEPWPLSA
jgi:HPt (histidine-containing phosphotransfer) domain-containing protein